MNKTEQVARKWIALKHNIDVTNVLFSANESPDFTIPGGTSYEVKRLYGRKIILYRTQVEVFRLRGDIRVLTFGRDSTEPLAQISAAAIIEALDSGYKSVNGIDIVVVPPVIEDQRDYHVALDGELNQRLLKYLATEFRENSRVVSAIFKKALEEFLEKKGY